MRRAAGWALAASLITLAGCSALGLTDGVSQLQGCGDCAELNALQPPPECMSWECSDRMNPEGGFCVLDLLDGDDDGAPLMRCALDERAGDCDDEAAHNSPGAQERCDGVDNNCNGRVDEQIPFEQTVIAEGNGDLSGIAWAALGSGVVGGYFDESRHLHLNRDGDDQGFGVSVGLSPRASFGVLRTDLLVASTHSDCPSLVIGSWTPPATALEQDDAQLSDGAPSTVSCDDATVASAAIVGRGSRVALSVSVHNDGAVDACGSTTGGTAVGLALDRVGGRGLVARTPADFGTFTGLGGPALLELGDFGVLLALVSADGIELSRVALDPLLSTPVATIPCDGVCGHVSLALLGAERVVGVAYRGGPCAAPEVRLMRLSVGADSLTALDAAPVVLASGEINQTSIAARSSEPRWAVAWTDAQHLRAARVADAPVGEALAVHDSPGFLVEPILVTYDSAALSVYAYDANTQQLFRARAACGLTP